MDETTLLRKHRASTMPPGAEIRSAARAALLECTNTSCRRRAELRRSRHWRLPALATFSLAIVAATFAITVNGGDGPLAPEVAAAEVLRAAVTAADARPFDPDLVLPDDGQYRYTRSKTASLSIRGAADGIAEAYAAIVPVEREFWLAADGSGRIRETADEPIFLGQRDRERWEADGRPALGRSFSQHFGPDPSGNSLFYTDLSQLPTDPDELATVLRARAASVDNDNPVAFKMFEIIGDLLRETVAPPALRAALYEVAAELPGLELVGTVTDETGRAGIAVAMTSETGVRKRRVMIFDPDTSELLGTETILLERTPGLDADPPVRIGYAVFLESRIVDGLPSP